MLIELNERVEVMVGFDSVYSILAKVLLLMG
jgi:hypothetical protein